MEYALICSTFALSVVSLIISLKLLKRFEKTDAMKKNFYEDLEHAKNDINEFHLDLERIKKDITDNAKAVIDELESKCQNAKDIYELLVSRTGRLAVVDDSRIRTFTYDAFMETESEEQKVADAMLKYQTEVLMKNGAKILDSNVKLETIPHGTVHRVLIKYLVNPVFDENTGKETI